MRAELAIGPELASDDDVAALVAALDDDGGGTLSIHELADFVRRGSATFGAGQEKIDEAAADKLQKRFQRALGKHRGTPAEFFRSFDKTGDGVFDERELLTLVREQLKITPDEVDDHTIGVLVSALDDDGSGTLAIDELLDFVENGSETPAGGAKKKNPVGPDWMLRLRSPPSRRRASRATTRSSCACCPTRSAARRPSRGPTPCCASACPTSSA